MIEDGISATVVVTIASPGTALTVTALTATATAEIEAAATAHGATANVEIEAAATAGNGRIVGAAGTIDRTSEEAATATVLTARAADATIAGTVSVAAVAIGLTGRTGVATIARTGRAAAVEINRVVGAATVRSVPTAVVAPGRGRVTAETRCCSATVEMLAAVIVTWTSLAAMSRLRARDRARRSANRVGSMWIRLWRPMRPLQRAGRQAVRRGE